MLINFSVALVFLLVAFLFLYVSLVISKLIRPNNPSPEKNMTYECGEAPEGSGWLNFNVRFYFIALIFIIFDVEIAFVLPVATIFKSWVARNMGTLALVELIIFIGILFIGLIYVWIKGDLSWIKDFVKGGTEPIKTFEKDLMPNEGNEAKSA